MVEPQACWLDGAGLKDLASSRWKGVNWLLTGLSQGCWGRGGGRASESKSRKPLEMLVLQRRNQKVRGVGDVCQFSTA